MNKKAHALLIGVFSYGSMPQWKPTGKQPAKPVPIKILVNWMDENKDGIPDLTDTYVGAQFDTTLRIIGLNQTGKLQTQNVTIKTGDGRGTNPITIPLPHMVHTTPYCIWSEVSRVVGLKSALGDEYFVFADPPL